MDEIHVTGKASLSGEIFIQGSKNAALPMIAASLMHRGLSILRGCPRISDVFCMEQILKSLGAVTWWDDHDLIWIVPAQTEQKFLQSIQAECVLRSFWQVRCLQETENAG